MKSHPRNEGSDSLDLALLVGMVVSVFVLTGIVWYLALPLQAANLAS